MDNLDCSWFLFSSVRESAGKLFCGICFPETPVCNRLPNSFTFQRVSCQRRDFVGLKAKRMPNTVMVGAWEAVYLYENMIDMFRKPDHVWHFPGDRITIGDTNYYLIIRGGSDPVICLHPDVRPLRVECYGRKINIVVRASG